MKADKQNMVRHLGENYELDISEQHNSIMFSLRTNVRKELKLFKNTYHYDALSWEIRNNFTDMSQFFKYLTKKHSYRVDVYRGIISMKVKRLQYNELIEKQEMLKLKEIGINLKDKPYELLVADVQELKLDIYELKGILKMNNVLCNYGLGVQDKEEYVGNKNNMERDKDQFIQFLKVERERDLQRQQCMMRQREVQNTKVVKQLQSQLSKTQNEIKALHRKINELNFQKQNKKHEMLLLDQIHQLLKVQKQQVSDEQKVQEVQKIQKVEQFQKRNRKKKRECPSQEKKAKVKEQEEVREKEKIQRQGIQKEQIRVQNTQFTKKFRVQRSLITYEARKYEKQQWTQIILKNNRQIKNKYRFTTKILKSKSNNIIIGMVDKDKQINSRYSLYTGNAICYSGYDGTVSYGNSHGEYESKEMGTGFREGDKVSVEVDFLKGSVKWFINNKQKAFTETGILKKRRIYFVPYIEMYNSGDQVQVWEQ